MGQEWVEAAGEKMPVWRRWWFVTAAGLVLLALAAGSLAESEETSSSDDASDALPFREAGSVEEATTTSAAEPTSTTAEPWTWEGFRIDGSGDDVIDFDIPGSEPAVITIVHTGPGSFAVTSYDTAGDRIALLVDEIGAYSGRHGINLLVGEDVAELGVVAGGAWSVTASPLLEAATLDSTYSGHGDDLLLLTGSGGRLEMTHNGDSNFAVVAWGDGGRDLLVNELGAYSGTARLDSGTGLLTITADGSWTMTVDQAG